MKKYIILITLLAITVFAFAQDQTINGNLSVGGKLYLLYSDRNATTNLYQTYLEYEGHDFNIGTRKGSNSHNVIRLKPGGYESAELGTTLELHRSVNLSGSVRTTLFSSNNGANNFINNGGNFGIGTTNPRALLDIGNLSRNKLKSVLARSDEGNNDGEGTYLGVKTYNTQPVSGESYSNVKSFALEHKFYGQLNNSINFYRGSGYTGDSISLAVDNGKEIARFHSTGFNLAGTINARQVNITVSAGADHVFYPDYALMPLSEVESFVKENKHLPDIPSEKQMVENGLNVNEMQIKLLQKIEELTLYVIDLKKENEKQDKQNKDLQKQVNELKAQLNDNQP